MNNPPNDAYVFVIGAIIYTWYIWLPGVIIGVLIAWLISARLK